jgi:hypothetical protein
MANNAVNTRPLTSRMLEILMDCHERELMNLEPCEAGTVHFVTGLIDRGMLSTKTYVTNSNKKIIAFYVTHTGRAYLNKLSN